MSNITLPVVLIIIQTVLVTVAFSYWFHIRSVRRLTSDFKVVLEKTIGIIIDDPRYTVDVKTIDPKSHHPSLKLYKQPKYVKHPYDWKIDEEFDRIIKSFYSSFDKDKPESLHKDNPDDE